MNEWVVFGVMIQTSGAAGDLSSASLNRIYEVCKHVAEGDPSHLVGGRRKDGPVTHAHAQSNVGSGRRRFPPSMDPVG